MLTYYIQINVICLMFLGLVYSRLRNRRENMSASRLTFLRLIAFAALLAVSDLVAFSVNGGSGNGSRFLIEFSNIVYYLALSWCCFAWLVYVNLRLYGVEYDHKKRMLIGAIPLLILSAVICLNPVLQFMFSVDKVTNTYARGNGIVLHWIVNWGYLLTAEVKVILHMRRMNNRAKREKLIPFMWFIAAPVVAAIVQMIFYGITVMQCGITFSIVLMAFGELQDKISRDALTGLNNRGAFETYINEKLQKERMDLTLVMCDVDRFKTINDNLGHLVGDLALTSLAEVLRNACGSFRCPTFLCRYGGDEFVICAADVSEQDMQELVTDIQNAIAQYNSGAHNVFTLEISVGMARADCEHLRDVEELLQTADNRMYEVKKNKKLTR